MKLVGVLISLLTIASQACASQYRAVFEERPLLADDGLVEVVSLQTRVRPCEGDQRCQYLALEAVANATEDDFLPQGDDKDPRRCGVAGPFEKLTRRLNLRYNITRFRNGKAQALAVTVNNQSTAAVMLPRGRNLKLPWYGLDTEPVAGQQAQNALANKQAAVATTTAAPPSPAAGGRAGDNGDGLTYACVAETEDKVRQTKRPHRLLNLDLVLIDGKDATPALENGDVFDLRLYVDPRLPAELGQDQPVQPALLMRHPPRPAQEMRIYRNWAWTSVGLAVLLSGAYMVLAISKVNPE
jgi:hypothetical protein